MLLLHIYVLCAYLHVLQTFIKVHTEVKAVYNTENGEREFSDSFYDDVQDHFYDAPLLTPGSSYVFNITAHTINGPGPTVSKKVTLNDGREGKTMYVHVMHGFCFVNKLVMNCNMINLG